MTMTDRHDVVAPDINSVYLATACEVFAAADTALWKLKAAIGDTLPPSVGERRHLEELKSRRMEAYFNVVSWANLCEADRLALEVELKPCGNHAWDDNGRCVTCGEAAPL